MHCCNSPTPVGSTAKGLQASSGLESILAGRGIKGRASSGALAPCPSSRSFGLCLELITGRALVAAFGAKPSSVQFPVLDLMLKTKRRPDRWLATYLAPPAPLHPQLILALPRDWQVCELVFNGWSHRRPVFNSDRRFESLKAKPAVQPVTGIRKPLLKPSGSGLVALETTWRGNLDPPGDLARPGGKWAHRRPGLVRLRLFQKLPKCCEAGFTRTMTRKGYRHAPTPRAHVGQRNPQVGLWIPRAGSGQFRGPQRSQVGVTGAAVGQSPDHTGAKSTATHLASNHQCRVYENSEELILILITDKNLLSARPPVLSDARVKSVW